MLYAKIRLLIFNIGELKKNPEELFGYQDDLQVGETSFLTLRGPNNTLKIMKRNLLQDHMIFL